jgi:sugar-specific transcriptional regulator TrmB
VYVELAQRGESSARLLAERLGVARPSVYDHLAPLISLGLVILLDRDGKTVFAIHDLADLERLIEEKKERMVILKKRFEQERDMLMSSVVATEPKIKFFEGKEGIIHIMRDMLWEAEGGLKTVWPYQEMLLLLGQTELEEFNRKRIRNKTALRSIWTSKPKQMQHIWKGGDFKVERRYAPKNFTPAMGYNIYGDKVSFMSSGKESYGFIVRSEDFVQLMSAQFEVLWKESKEK